LICDVKEIQLPQKQEVVYSFDMAKTVSFLIEKQRLVRKHLAEVYYRENMDKLKKQTSAVMKSEKEIVKSEMKQEEFDSTMFESMFESDSFAMICDEMLP
jgi:hypothetical protein